MRYKKQRQPIYGLDFVRFFAAIAVLLYHLGFKPWVGGNETLARVVHAPGLPGWYEFTWWGWIGVQIFFVVSGLVISYSIDTPNGWTFARRRILRLVPTAWICAIFALLVMVFYFGSSLTQSLNSFARVMMFAPQGPYIVGQFWTLPIECFFYAAIAILIWFRQSSQLEALAWLLALASLVFFVLVKGMGFENPFGRISMLLLLQHGAYFALGIILARADSLGWRPRHIGLVVICLALAWVQIDKAAIDERLPDNLANSAFVPFAIFLLSMVAVFFSLHFKDEIAAKCHPIAGFVRYLGLLTYPLYLVHNHAGGPVMETLSQAGYAPWISIGTGAIASILAASVVLWWLEKPIRQALDKVLQGGAFIYQRFRPAREK